MDKVKTVAKAAPSDLLRHSDETPRPSRIGAKAGIDNPETGRVILVTPFGSYGVALRDHRHDALLRS
jgi:hypothetical protein